MEKKNVALLILCQALAMTSMTVLFMVAALIGNDLAMDKSLATLPLALLQLAVSGHHYSCLTTDEANGTPILLHH